MTRHSVPKSTPLTYSLQFIVITISSFLLAGLALGNPPWKIAIRSNPEPLQCTTATQAGNDLSRDQLAELSQVEEQSTRANVQNVLGNPYCQVSMADPQTTENATGEAYRLAFDPQTWLVVLYRDEAYVGYEFKFR